MMNNSQIFENDQQNIFESEKSIPEIKPDMKSINNVILSPELKHINPVIENKCNAQVEIVKSKIKDEKRRNALNGPAQTKIVTKAEVKRIHPQSKFSGLNNATVLNEIGNYVSDNKRQINDKSK